jgi:PBP1b-binding outer membrane lipoprotein LpoB
MGVFNRCALFLPVLVLLIVLPGCFTVKSSRPPGVIEPSRPVVGTTGIEPGDVQTVCDRMARDILSCGAIAKAHGPPTIAVNRVENRTRFRIDAEIFTDMIRDKLVSFAGDKLVFVAREDLSAIQQEKAQKTAGRFDATTQKSVRGADFFLSATFRSMSAHEGSTQQDYVVYEFRLVDAESDEIVWSKTYETAKAGDHGGIYE